MFPRPQQSLQSDGSTHYRVSVPVVAEGKQTGQDLRCCLGYRKERWLRPSVNQISPQEVGLDFSPPGPAHGFDLHSERRPRSHLALFFENELTAIWRHLIPKE